MASPAVFLDRDGTLIEDRGDLSRPDQVVFFPGVAACLRRLQSSYRLFLYTQQSAVSQGRLRLEDVAVVNRHVHEVLAAEGVRIEAVYCCPHGPEDGCRCRKTSPDLLRQAAAEHGLDLSRSFMIGDHPHDARCMDAAGGEGIMVLTGHGPRHRDAAASGLTVVQDLRAAADWIRARAFYWDDAERADREIQRAADELRAGRLVVFPTETVYGLGANVWDPRALARVFVVKGRPRFDPLIVHVDSFAAVERVACSIPERAHALMRSFWPGPLTLVLPRRPDLPDLACSGLPTVAVRMPSHPVAQALIRAAGVSLAAPSANRFGRTSPTRVAHARQQLGGDAAVYLDGGNCGVGLESTVLDLSDPDRPMLLRPGGVSAEALEPVCGALVSAAKAQPVVHRSPGTLAAHYATSTRLWLDVEAALVPNPERWGWIGLNAPPVGVRFGALEILSETGDLCEAATRLFAALHRLDAIGLEGILAQSVPAGGLGTAINDRLKRAAAAHHRDDDLSSHTLTGPI